MAEVVDLYGRVSTQEQATEGYSIGEQETRLKMFAEAHGWTVHRVYMDGGYSGGNTDRPGLQALIADAKAGRITKAVVYKLDRLSRSQKDTLYLIEDIFIAHNIGFVSMTENLDTTSPLGMAMIGILSVFAQLERSQIAERMMVGRDARAKGGKFHGGGLHPIGYDYADGVLSVNEYEAMQVREAQRLYISGMPNSQIAQELNRRGYRTKYGDWHPLAVRRACEIRLYMYEGNLEWRGNYYKGCHAAITTAETADALRAETARRHTATQYKAEAPFRRKTMLSGILFCGKCGLRYRGENRLYSKKGERYSCPTYVCYGRHGTPHTHRADGSPKCYNKIWREDELNPIILGEIRKLSADPSAIDDIIPQGSEPSPALAIEGKILSIDKQIDRLIDLLQNGLESSAKVAARIASLEEERDRLEDSMPEPAPSSEMIAQIAKNALVTFSDLNEAEYTADVLQPIVRQLIQRVVVDDDEVTIHWNFE